MSEPKCNRGSRERGYSLAEILVAMAVFTAVILAALMVYDRSNKVFKQSVEASDMQQSTRVAFDRLVADVRMSGFDYDRDGTPFGSLAADWTGLTTYTTGMLVQPKSNVNGHTYICIKGGKTAGSEPAWPEADKETVEDGEVVWQESGTLQYQQPDEQIEYAGEHAIAIRANFNYGTATGPCKNATDPCENGREPLLQSSVFQVVTTDNDEIVIYALKPVAWKSGESADDLVFYADTAIPRNANPATDGAEQTVTISGVDLCNNGGCNSPPYTLYRYTLDEKGEPDEGTPVADNIRNMTFRYFDTTSAADTDLLASYPGGAGKYDGSKPNATITERDDRATIRAIELTLVGMNAQKDTKYTDASDTVAPHHRKLTLKSLVVPRNIGRRGMKEYNTEEPGAPDLVSVCAGSCNAVYLTWKAPETGGDIDSYAILYDEGDCAAAGGVYAHSEEIGLNLEGSIGRYITPGQQYAFAVQAINKWGAKTSNCRDVFVVNKTKPAALKELIATHKANPSPYEAVENQVRLYFPAASSNVSGQDELTCTGGGGVTQGTMPPPEKRYYEILRAVDDVDFQPGDTGVVKVLDAGSTNQPVSTGSGLMWTDTTAANCTTYHYRIRVVDYCARDADLNDPVDVNQGTSDYYPPLDEDAVPGQPATSTKPKAPTLLLKDKVCEGMSNKCLLTLEWSAVTQNTDDEAIYVRQYILRSYLWTGTAYNTTADTVQTLSDGVLTATHQTAASDQTKFEVTALDCNESAPSNSIIFPCTFTGGTVTATMSAGSYGGTGTAADPYIVEAPTLSVTTSSNVSEITATSYYVDGGAQVGGVLTQTGPTTSASFGLPETTDGKVVKVLIVAKDSGGCTKNAEVYMRDDQAPLCALTDTGTKSTLISTPGSKTVQIKLENTGSTSLTLLRVVVKFALGSPAQTLESISFNGGVAQTVNCSLGTAKITPSSTQTIGANNVASPYPILLTFSKNTSLSTVTQFCAVYRASTGDVLACQMHPTAVACTEPSGTCQ